ncbi:SURF1 family cytochrome oxidase biogenesis protein [Caulobacter sp. 17J65-9]|uniref:SURF1 family protein n=1 Tax=Caulobacter sp. 17J65-9 TaxID=2709382 RepID=UPI0013CAD64D|nr:SURF1 family cytochrome oxidase biogenesis protein [Caulobacter sp. 17J65-9]NEX93543.1 SURF1 family protein [Caulobacter sp. 17J65-9]
MTTSKGDRSFPVVLTVFTAVALAILVALGMWQVQRRAWKEDLLARIEALKTAPPRPVESLLVAGARGEDIEFSRVTAVCPGLNVAPFVELYALREGEIGSRLISACPVEGTPYGVVLVDRGFVPETISSRPPVDATARNPVTVTGVLRSPDARTFVTPENRPDESRFFSRDAVAMASALDARKPAPWFLMVETSTNPEWQALDPSPLPAAISNRHLEYALTWFGLAAALLGVYVAAVWRRMRP